MIKIHSSVVLLPVVPMLGVILFVGGCGGSEKLPTSKAGDVDQIPLLVRFENHCPKGLIQIVESCDSGHKGDDVICREHGKRIIWRAVTGASPPYQPDTTDFDLAFKDATKDPTEHSGGGRCKQSGGGVLDCKIKSDTAHAYYDYSLVSGTCSLDPRIYVP